MQLRLRIDRGSIGAERLLVLIPICFLGVLFVYPLAQLIHTSINGPEGAGVYQDVAVNRIFLRAALRTGLVALSCTIICLLLGFPLAYEITRPGTRWRTFLLVMVLLTFWISVLIRAYTWIVILQPAGLANSLIVWFGLEPINLEQSLWAITIGMTHFLLPYMVLVLVPPLRAVDSNLIDAAHSLGAGRWRTLSRVVVPLTMGGIIAGSLLTFILALGFFVMPAILGGPALPFVANLIGDQVGSFVNFPAAAAMGILLTAVVIIIYALLLRIANPATMIGGQEP